MNTTQQLFEAQEKHRKRDEMLRNEQRFFDFNKRRKARGLPEFKYTDYLSRKHGLAIALEKAHKAIQPEHRDNLLLFTR